MKLDFKAIGSRIRGARKGQNVTIRELADKLGYSTSFIGHVERGECKANVEALFTLCTALDISMDELLKRAIVDDNVA